MSYVAGGTHRCTFAWQVDRPFISRERRSNSFMFRHSKVSLTFYIDKSKTTYCLRMNKSIFPFERVNVSVHVETKTRQALPLSYNSCVSWDNRNNNTIIWQYEETEILTVYPDFFREGLLTFLVSDVHASRGEGLLTFLVNDVHHPKEIKKKWAATSKDRTRHLGRPAVQAPSGRRVTRTRHRSVQSAQMVEKSVQTCQYIKDISCIETLSTDLLELLQNQDSQQDVLLVCGENNFKTHSNVLCARSKAFAEILKSKMSEAGIRQIELKDMDGEIFNQFVRYLYTGKLSNLTADTVVDLYEAADKYDVASLMKRCSSFLEENLMPDNACEMLLLADAHSDQDFKESVMNYIILNEIPLQDEHWLAFSVSHPMLALKIFQRFCKFLKGE